jgi:hypothetical protein
MSAVPILTISVSVVREGRVDGLILGREEAAWLQACWRAATG